MLNTAAKPMETPEFILYAFSGDKGSQYNMISADKAESVPVLEKVTCRP